MCKLCFVLAALVVTAIGMPVGSANADTVDTRFARLIKSGSTITVSNDHFLISRWTALGIAIYVVVSIILIVYLTISWFRHYNLAMHLVSTLGMAAIGSTALSVLLPRLGFVEYDGSLNFAGALLGSVAVVGIVAIHWKNTDANSKASPAIPPIQPLVDMGEAEPPGIASESLPQLLVEKLVEEGMPSAVTVAKYIVSSVEKIEGEDVYPELPGKLRSNACNVIIYEHDENTIIQGIRDSAPEDTPLARVAAKRLLSLCRKSSGKKIHNFIAKVDLFRTELNGYREQAMRNE